MAVVTLVLRARQRSGRIKFPVAVAAVSLCAWVAPAQAAPLPAPTSLAGPVAGAVVDDPEFAWATVAGAQTYELQLSDNTAFFNPVSVVTAATRFKPVTTLRQDGYHWRVRAIKADGEAGAWSSPAAFRREWLDRAPAGDGDGADQMLAARPRLKFEDSDAATAGVQLPKDQLTVSWSPVRRATYYILDFSTEPGFPAAGESSMVRRSCRTPHTTWTPSLAGRYSGTSGFDPCAFAGTPTSPASTRFLVEGQTYYVRVRAVDESPDGTLITSSWSDAARPGPAASGPVPTSFTVGPSIAPPTAADDPAVQTPAVSGGDFPVLSWRPVTGAVAYLVALAKDSSFNTTVVAGDNDLGTDRFFVTTNTAFIANQMLLDNTVGEPYHWYVLPCTRWNAVADDKNVCTGPTEAVNVPGRFSTFSKLSKPVGGISDTIDAEGTVVLSWADYLTTAPDGGGMKLYELEVRDAAGTVVDTVKTDNTAYIPLGKTYPAGDYTWRVRAVDQSGAPLPWSAAEAFTVQAGTGGGGAGGGGATGTGNVTVRLNGTQTVVFGRKADLAGTLTNALGLPVVGARLTIEMQRSGSTVWQAVGAATTTSRGAYATVVKPTVTSRFRAVFAGSPTDAADTSPLIIVGVSRRTSLRADRTTVARNARVTFKGAVLPRIKGLKVTVACRRNGRRVGRVATRTTTAGTFTARLKIASSKAVTCRAVPASTSTLAAGRSRDVTIRVR